MTKIIKFGRSLQGSEHQPNCEVQCCFAAGGIGAVQKVDGIALN